MYTLNVEKRDLAIKAKKIRKNGMVPCSISDGKKSESIHIQIPENDAKKLLREKGKGGKVLIKCKDSESYQVIIKSVVMKQLNNEIENITFQLLNENEYVSSFARIILKNKDKVPTMVYQLVTEIPYRALPQDLVEEVIIDLGKLEQGKGLTLKDLPIWKDSSLQISMGENTSIVSIS